MEDLNTLYYFTEVVEHGGFVAAGIVLYLGLEFLNLVFVLWR